MHFENRSKVRIYRPQKRSCCVNGQPKFSDFSRVNNFPNIPKARDVSEWRSSSNIAFMFYPMHLLSFV